jgi:DNA-binding MarR family transcriptional regulator
MSNASAYEPQDLLAYLLKHATRRLTELTDAALAPLDIDGKDFGVLRVLIARKLPSQQQVAETLSVDRTTMVAVLDALESKGIVTRRPAPNDRRRNVVELTERGLELFRQAEKIYADTEREFLAEVTAESAAHFRAVLRAVTKAHETSGSIEGQ